MGNLTLVLCYNDLVDEALVMGRSCFYQFNNVARGYFEVSLANFPIIAKVQIIRLLLQIAQIRQIWDTANCQRFCPTFARNSQHFDEHELSKVLNTKENIKRKKTVA